MNETIANKILATFDESDYNHVYAKLKTISLSNVMADSESLLAQTRLSILLTSDGDLERFNMQIKLAKRDFRDVIIRGA